MAIYGNKIYKQYPCSIHYLSCMKLITIKHSFVETACSDRDLVAIFDGSVYVRPSVSPDLSSLYLVHFVKDYKIIWYKR